MAMVSVVLWLLTGGSKVQVDWAGLV